MTKSAKTNSGKSDRVLIVAVTLFSTCILLMTCVPGAITVKTTDKNSEYVPEGYTLVWQDEFNDTYMPHPGRWYYETGRHGWGNNEIQNYIAGVRGNDTCAFISDGTLKIIAKKVGDEVLSVRLNTDDSWMYGYFEAALKLPEGKGTWPAFWMMPKNGEHWPLDGEIDIMEEVGYRPNWVSSAIHCQAYNHGIGTQKTGEQFISTAQSGFHVYAMEWTEDYIKGYVDGKCHFVFENDKQGNKETWPFNTPFYIKLNLAWGGNWGGAEGVDESFLPAVYEIDYVRVYRKK
ncbi:MAG: glycoside hydrolase family 16 protein [Tannerellaceae bacterium]|jgi:beta-glucanase (GH16 family)|nr:glycoside hydrolase family 16 protein [Tannerellaceae bacterium]